MKIGKELAKGSTGLLVLSVISEQEMYGYQIIQVISARSESVFNLNEGTLYPILHALEKEGCLSSYRAMSESGRERKYYRITPQGELWLKVHKEEWRTFSRAVNKIVNGEL